MSGCLAVFLRKIPEMMGISLQKDSPVDPRDKSSVNALKWLDVVPENSELVYLLINVNSEDLVNRAKHLGRLLIPDYDSVVIASRQRSSVMGKADSFVVKASIVPVAGIILAAGESRRFGKPKQLLTWRGKTLLRRTIETAYQAGLSPLVVVLGANADKIRPDICDLPVKIIENVNWSHGQSSSLKAGLNSLPSHVGGAVFLLADQPFVTEELLRELMDKYFRERKAITAPMVNGKRTSPVLFDQCVFPALLNLKGDTGGRVLFSDFSISWVPWDDERLSFDVDVPDDYERLQKGDF